jgi:hypothetical protein
VSAKSAVLLAAIGIGTLAFGAYSYASRASASSASRSARSTSPSFCGNVGGVTGGVGSSLDALIEGRFGAHFTPSPTAFYGISLGTRSVM